MDTKVCSRCKRSLNLESYSKNKAQRDGYSNYCKSCMKLVHQERKQRYASVVWDMQTLRTCSICGKEKYLSEFYFNNNTPKSECIECNKAYKLNYYQLHREEIISRNKQYIENNKSAVVARRIAHYIKNRGAILAQKKEYAAKPDIAAHKSNYNKLYRKNNFEQISIQQKIYKQKHYQENKEYYLTKSRNRRSRLLNAEGSHTSEDITSLLRLQDAKCVYCGEDITHTYTVDHYTPLILGGRNSSDNLQLLCSTCNKRKGPKDPEEYESLIGFNREKYLAGLPIGIFVPACIEK